MERLFARYRHFTNHCSLRFLFGESWMAQRREGSAAAGTKLGRDVTAQVGPLIVLERAANLASGLNKDG